MIAVSFRQSASLPLTLGYSVQPSPNYFGVLFVLRLKSIAESASPTPTVPVSNDNDTSIASLAEDVDESDGSRQSEEGYNENQTEEQHVTPQAV